MPTVQLAPVMVLQFAALINLQSNDVTTSTEMSTARLGDGGGNGWDVYMVMRSINNMLSQFLALKKDWQSMYQL